MILGSRNIWKSVYSTLFISRVISGLLQVVMFAFVAREIGSNNFGPMMSALVTVQLIGTVLEFGFGSLLMSRRFFIEERHLTGTLLSSNILISGLEASCGLFSYLLLPIRGHFLPALALLLVWGAGERLTNLGLSFAISQSNPQEVRRNILSRRLLTFTFFSIITVECTWNDLSFCFFLAASSAAGGLISVFRYRDYLTGINWKYFRVLLKLGFPFQMNSILNQFRNLDVLLLNFFATSTVAGTFALAFRFSQPFSIPMSALAQTGITAISSNDLTLRNEFLTRYLRVLKYCIFFGFIVFLCPAQSIANKLLPNYPTIDFSFKLQVFALILFGVIATEISILQGIGEQRFLYRISTLLILMTLALTATGGRFFGVVGASTGLFLGNLIQSIVLYRYRRMKSEFDE